MQYIFQEYLGLYTRFDAISGLAVLEKAPLPKDVINALGVNRMQKIWHDKKRRGRGVTEDRATTLLKEHEQHPTMDKQNKEIQDPSEDGDPGRHERLVTVGGFGKQEGLHKKKQRRFISCT